MGFFPITFELPMATVVHKNAILLTLFQTTFAEDEFEFSQLKDDAHALYKLATSDDSRALNANQISECVQVKKDSLTNT